MKKDIIVLLLMVTFLFVMSWLVTAAAGLSLWPGDWPVAIRTVWATFNLFYLVLIAGIFIKK